MPDDGLEMLPIDEPGRLTESAHDAGFGYGRRTLGIAGRHGRTSARLTFDVPHLQGPGEIGRQLGR